MATVEVVSAQNAFHEDTNEASLKTEQEKITQEEVVETPTPAPEQTNEEEVALVTKATEPAAPEGKPLGEVETKDVVEIEAKVESVTITQEPTVVEKKEEETEAKVYEETNENADPVEPETGIQNEEVVEEDKVAEPKAKDKDNTEAAAEQSEEKVDTEAASDDKKEEEVIAAEAYAKKSEEVIDAPSDEKSE